MGGFSMLLAHSNSVFSYLELNHRVSSVMMHLRKLFTLSCNTKTEKERIFNASNDWSEGGITHCVQVLHRHQRPPMK